MDGTNPKSPVETSLLSGSSLESLKWHLWHGNVYRALQIVAELEWDLESQEKRSERAKKLLKAVGEFHHYIEVNQASIPNYGDRYRHGKAISTAFAESTVNQVISKRMVKNQLMRWTERGAHLLLQVRTQVLNGGLRTTFQRWYPGMKAAVDQAEEAAAKLRFVPLSCCSGVSSRRDMVHLRARDFVGKTGRRIDARCCTKFPTHFRDAHPFRPFANA